LAEDESEIEWLNIVQSFTQNVRSNLSIIVRCLVLKCLYLVVLSLALARWGSYDGFFRVQIRWPTTGWPSFESHFASWDSAHYLLLAVDGYSRGMASCAFYPLWPILLSIFDSFHLSVLWGGIFLSNLFSATAWTLFYRLASRHFGEVSARWALALLILYPGALFYQFAYSESLFLLGIVSLIESIERRRWGWAIGAAFCLPIIRGPGLFTVLPLLWTIAAHRRWDKITHLPRFLAEALSRTRTATYADLPEVAERPALGTFWFSLAAMPLIGWITYLTLMWHWTGNPFEGIEAQKYWGRHSILNLINVPRFVNELLTPTTVHEYVGSILDRILFIPTVYSLLPLWRRNPEWALWTVVLGVLPAMSGGFTSFTRFSAIVFPCFWLLGNYIATVRIAYVKFLVPMSFAVLHGVLVWRFMNFGWAG
jgi:hypothetical protein